MKKLLILLCLLMVSCSNDDMNQVSVTPKIEESIETETARFGYKGYLGKDEFSIQYNESDGAAFGKYEMDNKDILFRGEVVDGVSLVKDEYGDSFMFVHEEESLYGIRLKDHVSIFASKVNIQPNLSESTMSLQGDYLSYSSDFFNQSIIKMTPLFDHLLYLEIIHSDKIWTFLALKNDSIYDLLTSDVSFELTDEREIVFDKPLILDTISLDQRYSESIEIQTPSFIDLGITKDEIRSDFLKDLCGSYYDLIISHGQVIDKSRYNGYNKYSLNLENQKVMIEIYEKDDNYYIWLDKKIIDSQSDLLVTNTLVQKPSFLEGQVMISPMLLSGYQAPMMGEVNDYIPDGFELLDKAVGYLDEDSKEDTILVIDSKDKSARILLVLIKSKDDYQLALMSDRAIINRGLGQDIIDPYESIDIVDHKIILKAYGGTNKRWSHKHYFDALYDYRLIKSEISIHNLDTNFLEQTSYDFVSNQVVLSSSTNIYKKTLLERIYLDHFDGLKLFDLDYR